MATIKAGSTELRHLRYFLAVADAAHFRRAATSLHISQPTLSHQIKQLELQMGAAMFERFGRTVRLTAAGQVLRERALAMMRELADAKQAIAELLALEGGRLRVGIVSTVNVAVVPEAVCHFHQRHPKVAVSIRELSMEQLESDLLGGRLDLGIGLLHARVGARLAFEPLFEERLVAVLPRQHQLAQRRSLTLGSVLSQPFVLLSLGFCTRELVEESADRLGLGRSLSPTIEMNSIDAVLSTVRRTGLPTLLPNDAVHWATYPELLVVPLTDSQRRLPRRRVGLLWTKGGYRTAAATAFALEIQKIIRRSQPTMVPAG